MRVVHCVRFLSAALLLAFVSGLPAQDQGLPSSPHPVSSPDEKAATEAPVLRGPSNLMTVDVIVSHNGHAVPGLEKRGFHVFEDGREQTIQDFRELGPGRRESTIDGLSAQPAGVFSNVPQASDSPINVLLLDIVNTPVKERANAWKEVIEYLKTAPPESHLVVFVLASRLRLLVGPTADSSFRFGSPGNSDAAPSVVPVAASQAPMAAATERLQQLATETEARSLDRVPSTLAGLKQLALYLGALPGRKNVIWVSASFPLSLDPQSPLGQSGILKAFSAQLQQLSDLFAASRVALYPVDARGLVTDPSTSPQVFTAARGRGMIDISAFPTANAQLGDPTSAEHATMLQLADATGGVPFYNGNALKQAISKALESGASYYTLAYSPENRNLDGKFRKLEIKYAGHDYHLSYRRGYFAEPPAAGAVEVLSVISPRLLPDAPPSSQILFRARVLTSADAAAENLRSQDGPAGDLGPQIKGPVKRYWIEYTADMRQVSAEADARGVYRAAVEFIVIAYDRDGKVVNAARRNLKLGMPPAKYEEFLRTGYSVRSELDLPAEGDLWLRLAVHDVSADRVGSVEVPLARQTENTD